MDKRQEKTLEAIYLAFGQLISKKDYEDITIQDILDASKVGRSTFYSHFKTKNELLRDISKTIFEHVFSHSLQEEKSHDFSKESFYDYKHLITHVFYHIKDEKDLIKGILSSKGNTIFLQELKNNLMNFADSYFKNYPYKEEESLPIKLKKAVMVENFIVIIYFWIQNDFNETPEILTNYFVTLVLNK